MPPSSGTNNPQPRTQSIINVSAVYTLACAIPELSPPMAVLQTVRQFSPAPDLPRPMQALELLQVKGNIKKSEAVRNGIVLFGNDAV